jgi:Ca2+-binding RTX toxin-like protein
MTVALLVGGVALAASIDCKAGTTCFGTSRADTMTGTAQADEISGRGGGDTIYGRGEGDAISGGEGNDDLRAGLGNDPSLDGGPGDQDVAYVDTTTITLPGQDPVEVPNEAEIKNCENINPPS